MQISQSERDAVYKTIFNRRDTRSEFLDEILPEEQIKRLLTAAHHSPSVGFMQPWDFLLIKDKEIKTQIKEAFIKANKEEKEFFQGDKKELYSSLKLEGITQAPLGICITCDRNRTGEIVLGRTKNKQMDLYSSVCAVQTLWLAARAENLGLGWVSIISHDKLKEILKIPENIEIIAYLCIGKVKFFHEKPELEKVSWLKRNPLEDHIHFDTWNNKKE